MKYFFLFSVILTYVFLLSLIFHIIYERISADDPAKNLQKADNMIYYE